MRTDASLLDDLRRRLGDKYEIVRELGRGGMGAVLLARDRALDRPVALKVLPPEFASQPDLHDRFLRETRLAAGFSHPNIVPVFSIEDRDGLLAYAMGYVEGESLAERVRRSGPLTAREAVKLLQDVGYALSYAHGRGVVHRDIKPDNIMLERATGRAMVMDFGIARAIAPTASAPGLTRVGEVVGTPEYMSPEQASGDHVDGRSDLYSLGLVAWFALAGRPAITGENTQKVLVQQLTQPVPSIGGERPELPVELVAVIDRCTAKEPAERFDAAEALVEALDAARLGAPEVPLAVRLFQVQWQKWIGNALLFAGIAALLYERTSPSDTIDRMVILAAGVAVQFVLYMTVRRQAGTMRFRGYTHDAVLAGFRALLAEGDEARAQALSLPGVARGRRLRLVMAPFLMLLGTANVLRAANMRVEVEPGHFVLRPLGVATVVSGAIAFVIGALLLATDPYRRPLLQRAGNVLLASALGRWLLRAGSTPPAASVPSRPGDPSAPTRRPATPAPARARAPDDEVAARLARLEARLEVLERERVAP